MKTTVSTASAPTDQPVDGPVARRTFRQELGDLAKVVLFSTAAFAVIAALSVYRYTS